MTKLHGIIALRRHGTFYDTTVEFTVTRPEAVSRKKGNLHYAEVVQGT